MPTFRTLHHEVSDPGSAEVLTAEVFEHSMFDRRSHHRPFYVVKDAAGQRVEVPYTPTLRSWGQVRGITLHQTACRMGESVPRYDRLGAHFGITKTGKVLRMADLNRVVYHGNGWNAQCVGIEIDGLYAGLEDDPATVPDERKLTTWNDPDTPWVDMPDEVTQVAMEAARSLVRWIVIEVARNGGTLITLGAHRQSSGTRRNDPGEAIWKAVAVPLQAELGLGDGGPGFKIGDGYPIPTAWNPSYKGYRY